MTGETTLAPVDEILRGAPTVLWWGDGAAVAFEERPAPGPGDMDAETPTPAPRALERRVQVMIDQAITHKPLCELTTASVDFYETGFGPTQAQVRVSKWDPGWDLCTSNRIEAFGRSVGLPDAKGLEISIGVDGRLEWSGTIMADPIDLGSDGELALRCESPEGRLDVRTLGETEQRDFYGGRGRFDGASFAAAVAGWSKDPGVEWDEDLTNPYQGVRSLKAQGSGWVYGPWQTMMGQDGYVRYPVTSAMVQTPAGVPVRVATWVRLADGTPVREDFTLDQDEAFSDEGETGWQGPIAAKGWLTPEPVAHKVRFGVLMPAGGEWVSIDLVRLQWPTLTGFPSPRRLSEYPGRLMRDLQHGEGGSPEGITVVVREHVTAQAKITWPHQGDPKASECLAEVTDRPDGPDVWISPNWRMIVEPRRGEDRRDLMLGPEQYIAVRPTADPGGTTDEFRATTDLGSGSYRVVHAVDQPVRSNHRRNRTLTRTPNDMSFDRQAAWTAAQAEWAARTPFSAEVDLPLDEALEYKVGDGVLLVWSEGELGYAGPVRVSKIRVVPGDELGTLTVGTDPVVDL